MWKALPLLALLCSSAYGQTNVLEVTPAAKSQPSATIVIEYAPVPVAPKQAAAEFTAAEWGRAASEVAALQASLLRTWKRGVVARLEQHKQYPKEARSRREHGVAQVFFSLDRQGRVLESRVVRSSGSQVLDEEALALLKRAEPYPPPPEVFAPDDHVDLTTPIRFNLAK